MSNEDKAPWTPDVRSSELQLKCARRVLECISGDLDTGEIIKSILKAIDEVLGFQYATISLVDQEQELIETRHGIWKGEPDRFPEWLTMSRYALDRPDIQADIVRKAIEAKRQGKKLEPEIRRGWDPRCNQDLESGRLNREIWNRFEHRNLVRVFVPIMWVEQCMGTIEAGFYKDQRHDITEAEARALEDFASQAALVIHVAEYVEKLRQDQEREVAEAIAHSIHSNWGLYAHQLGGATSLICNTVAELSEILKTENPRAIECLDILHEAADHFAGFLRALKIGLDAETRGRVDVRDLLEHVTGAIRRPSEVAVQLSVPQDLPPVISDEFVLQAVFANLVANAYDAMREKGGKLAVSATHSSLARTVTVRFADTGPGIDESTKSSLGKHKVTPRDGHAGVGLYFTRFALERLGSKITLESTSTSGSVFTVILPTA